MTVAERRPYAPSTPVVALLLGVLLVALLAIPVLVVVTLGRAALPSARTVDRPRWPADGQAALRMPGLGALASTPDAAAVPIASVAKVMTALVVLERFPLRPGAAGFALTITRADVLGTARSRLRGESVVDVRAGEVISERDALLALMLPSANNMARALARQVAGSEQAFVLQMNQQAHALQLTATTYADAAGFDPRTVSTARDQVVLAEAAMQDPTFAWLVHQPSATVPVAGVIRSTDRLLGHHGYVGIKTGSDRAAGGCFVFAVHRHVRGQDRVLVGAVLGQRGPDLVEAAMESTERMVDSVSET